MSAESKIVPITLDSEALGRVGTALMDLNQYRTAFLAIGENGKFSSPLVPELIDKHNQELFRTGQLFRYFVNDLRDGNELMLKGSYYGRARSLVGVSFEFTYGHVTERFDLEQSAALFWTIYPQTPGQNLEASEVTPNPILDSLNNHRTVLIDTMPEARILKAGMLRQLRGSRSDERMRLKRPTSEEIRNARLEAEKSYRADIEDQRSKMDYWDDEADSIVVNI